MGRKLLNSREKAMTLIAIAIAAAIVISLSVFNVNNKLAPSNSESNTVNSTITSVSNSSMPTVNIGYVDLPIAEAYYIALDNGFFEKHGIKVNRIPFASEDMYVDAMDSNQIDCAATWSTSVMFSAEQQRPGSFKIFQVLLYPKNDSYTAIIVKKDSPIYNLSDLRGKKIAIYIGPSSDVLSTLAVEKAFGSKDAVKLIKLSPWFWYQALNQTTVDAVFSWEPFHTIYDTANLTRVVYDSPVEQIMDNIPATASVCSTSFINNHPDSAAKFKMALDDGIDYLNSHPNESRKSFLKYSKTIPNAQIAMQVHLPLWEKLNPDNVARLQNYIDLLADNHFLDKKLNATSMLYNYSIPVSP